MTYKEIWTNTFDQLQTEHPEWTDSQLEEETEIQAKEYYSNYCDYCYEQVRDREMDEQRHPNLKGD